MKKALPIAAIGFGLVCYAFAPLHGNKLISSSITQTGIWTLDKAHTNVKFSVFHLVISDVEGSFKSFDGTMESSKADYSDAKINFIDEVASISTDNETWDNHLKSPDFFDAAKFPQIKFVSTSFVPLRENKYT